MTNKLVVIINSLKYQKLRNFTIWNEISCTKLQLPPEPLTKGLQPPDPLPLCPLSSTEFVEPPRKKFLGTPLSEAIHQPFHFWEHLKVGLTTRQMTYIFDINALVFTSSERHVENYRVDYWENEQQSITHFKGQLCNSVDQYCKIFIFCWPCIM